MKKGTPSINSPGRRSNWSIAEPDREPSKFNLYCAWSRIIYASAGGGIYPQAYSPVKGPDWGRRWQKFAKNALQEVL